MESRFILSWLVITKRQEIGVDEAETSGATAPECFPEHAQDPPKRKRKFDFLFRKNVISVKLKYTSLSDGDGRVNNS